MIWSAWPTIDQLVPLLLFVIAILVGLVPSRHAPESPFLARQQWCYRDFVIVFCLVVIVWLAPSDVLKTIGIRAWAMEGISTLAIVLSVWGVVRLKHRRAWQALGFDRSTALYDTLWSLRIGLGVVSVLAVLVLSVRSLDPQNVSAPGRGVWHDQFGDFIASITVTTVFVPLAEELFFRGLAYGPLFRKLGAAGATIGTAAFWAAAHYSGLSLRSFVSMSVTFVLGIIYAEVYRRHTSLVPAVVFHIVQNMTAVFIRDRYLATLIPLASVSVGLWIVSALVFHAYRRRSPG